MTIPEMYDYLVRTRRDLWAALEAVPDEILSRQLLDGQYFRCIKDLVCHIAGVEDGWLHYTILRDEPVQHAFPNLKEAPDGFPVRSICPRASAGVLAGRGGEKHARVSRGVDTNRVEPTRGRLAEGAVQTGRVAVARNASRGAAHRTDLRAATNAGHQTAVAGSVCFTCRTTTRENKTENNVADGLTVKPLAPDTWDAFARLVEANNGVWGGCWCMGLSCQVGQGSHPGAKSD